MATKTNISWCDATWNIARGCTKVDADCKFCYMYRDSMKSTRYNPLEVNRTKTVFDFPLKYQNTISAAWYGRPLIFTSSLTDFFHEGCDAFRQEAWDIIRKCPHLIFQILTKRPDRIMANLPDFWDEIKGNVWMGTSVGSQDGIGRMVTLSMLDLNCIKFLSMEPLHQYVDIYSAKISVISPAGDAVEFGVLPAYDWIIVGAESGNETGKYQYRPCEVAWMEDIVTKAKREQIPVFVKQMGTYLSKQLKMSDRHGTNIDEFPASLQFREFPNTSLTR